VGGLWLAEYVGAGLSAGNSLLDRSTRGCSLWEARLSSIIQREQRRYRLVKRSRYALSQVHVGFPACLNGGNGWLRAATAVCQRPLAQLCRLSKHLDWIHGNSSIPQL